MKCNRLHTASACLILLLVGPRGRALRLDGYSNWFSAEAADELQLNDGLTVQAWIALEAYPVAHAPIVGRYTFPEAGYVFGLKS